MPIGFKVVAKTQTYTDEKSGEEKKKSSLTKNQMIREMIGRYMRNQVKCRYIVGDSWYSSEENMKYINKRKKVFLFELKDKRQAAFDGERRNGGQFERTDQSGMPENAPVRVWIKDLEFPVLIFKQVFKNKDGRGVSWDQ